MSIEDIIQRTGDTPITVERLVRDLQQQALLGIEVLGFSRRDAEKRCIETVHVVNESAEARRNLTGCVRVGIVSGGHREVH